MTSLRGRLVFFSPPKVIVTSLRQALSRKERKRRRFWGREEKEKKKKKKELRATRARRRDRAEMRPSMFRGQISWSEAESQQIAVRRLLYWLRHPDRELSRLQMILRPHAAWGECRSDPRPR